MVYKLDEARDTLLEKYAKRVPNQSFEEQSRIVKKLVEPQDGEDSDIESDMEEQVIKRPVQSAEIH